MRVLVGLAASVVLAVDGDPFLGPHAGGQPQPESEEMADQRVQIDGAVSLAAVQVQGDGGDRDLGQDERDEEVAPPGQRQDSEIPFGHEITRAKDRPKQVGKCTISLYAEQTRMILPRLLNSTTPLL